jgi:hypothetical protein
MVTEIRLYIEGGGSEEATKRPLRAGFHRLFSKINPVSRGRGVTPKPILCGGRDDTFKIFTHALEDHPDAINILLVDADCPVTTSRLTHVKTHFNRHWKGLLEGRCHLMVQVMESWFLADPTALRSFYSDGFNANPLRKSKNVESIGKDAVLKAIEAATRNSRKGKYDKIEHASKLLALISPEHVRKSSRHFDFLFKTLEELLQSTR